MNYRRLLAGSVIGLGLVSCANNQDLLGAASRVAQQVGQSGAMGSVLSSGEIAAGLKEALKVGSSNVVSKLGVVNGFNNDPAIHIPLPENLQKAKKIAAKFGLDRNFNELEQKLNAAAEAATPKAKALFLNAISAMTLDDAKGILNGPPDAATKYFREKTSGKLSAEMKPVVDSAMAEVGALQTYNKTVSGLGMAAGMMPDLQTDLSSYVVKKGMDGIFHYLAQEEAAIRSNPAKRTTELLRKVFQ